MLCVDEFEPAVVIVLGGPPRWFDPVYWLACEVQDLSHVYLLFYYSDLRGRAVKSVKKTDGAADAAPEATGLLPGRAPLSERPCRTV